MAKAVVIWLEQWLLEHSRVAVVARTISVAVVVWLGQWLL